jgi:PAS domain S-box-containing protein
MKTAQAIQRAAAHRTGGYDRSLLEASLDPLVTIGPDGKITDVNAATEVATGHARAALIGTDFSDYFTEPGKASAGYQQVFREGFVRDYPLELRHRDGSVISVLYNASLYRDKTGRVVGVFAAARDITARKRAEEAARRANAYNRSLLEASIDPLVAIGPDGKITDVNGATEAATGRLRAELIGTDFSDYFTEPDQARSGYQQVFREGLVREYPLELRHRDGRMMSVLYNASVYRDEAGRVIGVFAAARDVTARRRAEEAARRANVYNRSLLEASLDPLVTIGPDGRITDVNAATETATGCSRTALIGTDFSDYFTEPAKARAGYQQVFREGFVRDYPLELRHRRGRVNSVLYNASVYRDESGQVIGVFAAARDITLRKRAEEEMQHYAQELQRSNTELEHFAYVASHDLQEPLRTLSSYSQLLARRYRGRLDTDADDFIAFMVDAAARMQTLINDLLTFSRIGTRGKPFELADGAQVLAAAQENLQAAIAESGAVITHDPLPTLLGDPTHLTQLFQNLFSNAIKFRRADQPPRIHVSATRQEGAWELSVRDNGIGIDPQFFERIFIIFQRLHAREDYPGTGIGLALCKKIVERHGGRLWVESVPGTGSTFHFTLPDKPKSKYEPIHETSSPH